MYVANMFFTVFDLIIFYIACDKFFDRRYHHKILSYFTMVIVAILTFLVINNFNNIFLKYIVLIFIINMMLNVLFYGKKISIFLLVLVLYSAFFMIEFVFIMIIKMEGNLKHIFVIYVLTRLISVLLITNLRLKKTKNILEERYTVKFILISIISVIGLIIFIIPSEKNIVLINYLIPVIIMINNLFIYYMLKDFINISENLRMKVVSEERIKNELNFWKQIKEKDCLQKKIIHDHSNNLLCIKGLLEQKKYGELKTFVDNISAKYKFSKSFVSTGNHLFDVLINDKYEKALNNGITMILKLDNLKSLKIKNEDLIIIVGNLIDNGIEYCRGLEKDKREIFFSIENSEVFKMMVRNPIEEKIVVIDDVIKTTKTSGDHGLGLTNVKEIVQQYKGEYFIDVEEGYYTYYIEI